MTDPVLLVMGPPGHVTGPDMPTLLRRMGANAGNLVFQHAVPKLMSGRCVHLHEAGADWGDRALHDGARAVIFPAANHLRRGADWRGLNGYLARPGPPLVVLGLGVQAPLGAGVAETAAALAADPQAARLAAILRERAVLITVRGRFSQSVCDRLGLAGVQALGCPSVLLNPAPDLGRHIAARLARIRARLGGKGCAIRPVMAAAAPFEIRGNPDRVALEQRLFHWIVAERDGLYVQQSGGVAALQAASGGWDRLAPSTRAGIAEVLSPGMEETALRARLCRAGRMPVSASDWIAMLAGRDLVIGSRVHGVLAALAAGRPGVLVPHDARGAELARHMHLPVLERADLLAAPGPAAALSRVRFDPAAFDHWRRGAAHDMAAALSGVGVTPSAHLRALAGGAVPMARAA